MALSMSFATFVMAAFMAFGLPLDTAGGLLILVLLAFNASCAMKLVASRGKVESVSELQQLGYATTQRRYPSWQKKNPNSKVNVEHFILCRLTDAAFEVLSIFVAVKACQSRPFYTSSDLVQNRDVVQIRMLFSSRRTSLYCH